MYCSYSTPGVVTAMARRPKSGKTPRRKRLTPAQQRIGISTFQVEPDLTGMGGIYKIKSPKKPRVGGGVAGVGSKGAIRRSRSGKL